MADRSAFVTIDRIECRDRPRYLVCVLRNGREHLNVFAEHHVAEAFALTKTGPAGIMVDSSELTQAEIDALRVRHAATDRDTPIRPTDPAEALAVALATANIQNYATRR
jgi:hypothetical protein